MILTVCFSDEETRLIEEFAKLHGVSASEFVLRAALEKLENQQETTR